MRYYALDDLVDPLDGQPFAVEVQDRIARPGPEVEGCRRWCGYLGAEASRATPDDCAACAQLWVVSGWLVSSDRRYPILGGIPRLRPEDANAAVAIEADDRAVRESFGYEWRHFSEELPDYEAEAANYFRLVPRAQFDGATILDAGCGSGRWARHLASKPLRRLYAVDYSSSIEQAQRLLEQDSRAHCVQADIRYLPFRSSSLDLVYSLGVLHHLPDPDAGMRSLIATLRPGGGLLLYLYYALDNRPRHYRAIFQFVNALRGATSRLPKPLMHSLAWAIAIGVYWPLARLALVAELIGGQNATAWIPLHHYRRRSIRMMVLDAFDRFATPLERRYSRSEITSWLARYGLRPAFSESSPFWVVYAVKP